MKRRTRAIWEAAMVTLLSLTGSCTPPAPCATFRVLTSAELEPSVINVFYQLTTCDGTPLAGIEEEELIIKEDGVLLSELEAARQYTIAPRCFRQAVVLMLDMSGSIRVSGNVPSLQEAASAFVRTVSKSQSTAVYTFDGRATPQQLVGFTQDTDALLLGIASLSDFVVVDESTNLNGAVVAGYDILDQEFSVAEPGEILAGSLVIFTDGTDQAARVSDAFAVSEARASTHTTRTVGLGGEVDEDHLRDIGVKGSFFADDVGSLSGAFDEAAAAVQATADSHYSLAYCSPKRAGEHTLELSVEGRTGVLRLVFNADGFEGGCEPRRSSDEECLLDPR